MARLSALFALLLAATPLAQSAQPSSSRPKVGSRILPGAFIYELEDGQDTKDFHAAVNREGKQRLDLNFKHFKGISVQLDDIENAEEKSVKIASNPGVKNVWPVVLYPPPDDIIHSVANPNSKIKSSSIQKRDNTTGPYPPHAMTQIDKLHKEGYKGKGVKIAIVDTGVDYNHPALGGCFGNEDCLVTFGTDLVGDGYDGYNIPVPDKDPMDCQGHGTHVAGIVAAQPNEFDFVGGAPEAKIGMYRVFGCDGEAGNDVLIAAFNQAFEDGADIITSSVGGPSGWIDEPWSKAVSKIVDAGVPCTLSAGNSGDAGLFYASTAAAGLGVSSIASFDNIESPTIQYLSEYSIDGDDAQEFGYSPGQPSDWDGVKLPLWAADYDTTVPDGGCDPYDDDTPDLSKYIVLIRRGTCTYVQKAQNAAKFGAKYIMVYNNVPGAVEFDVSTVDGIVAAGMVVSEVGEKWIKALKAGSEVTLDVTGTDDAELNVIHPNNPLTGGALSSYTSWAPTWDLEEVNPSFGAPGGNILSTYPLDLGGYAVLSGTSMACPLAAAAYALISQVRGTNDPDELRNVVSSNANPQVFNDAVEFYDFLAPVPQQGAGLIRAHDAAHTNTIVNPAGFSFGDSDTLAEHVNFTLANKAKHSVTYKISHVPAQSMYTLDADDIYPMPFPNELANGTASLAFSETKVKVGSGESVYIGVIPSAAKDDQESRLPVWSGYIAVNGSDGSSLSIPYYGVTGSLYESTVLADDSAWIAKSTDENAEPVKANTTFILPSPGSDAGNRTLPLLAANLALGSETLLADLVSLSKDDDQITKKFFGTKSIGQPDSFPLKYVSRSLNSATFTGLLADGKYAAPGTYKVVFRALHIRGNPKKEKDWDVAETPAFTIKYA